MDNVAQEYLELTVIQLELGTGVIARGRGHFYRFRNVIFSDGIWLKIAFCSWRLFNKQLNDVADLRRPAIHSGNERVSITTQ